MGAAWSTPEKIKGERVYVFHQATCPENIYGSGGIAPLFLNLGTRYFSGHAKSAVIYILSWET
jgi:hypothetical protein